MIDFVNLMEARSLGATVSESDEDKFWYSDQWIMEPMYQGIRYQGLVDASGNLRFLGKRKEYKQHDRFLSLTQICNDVESNKLPSQTLFEGYLTFNNNKIEAYRFLKLDKPDVNLVNSAQFYLTDIIYLSGNDVFNLPLFDRKKLLQKVFKETSVVKIQQGYTKNKRKIFEELKKEIKVYLFKNLGAQYNFRQSLSSRIYKIPETYFMVVMGYVENKEDDELKNMIVALEGGQLKNGKLVKITNVPVHNNDSRIRLYNQRDKLIGKIFEILATEKTDQDEKYQEARYINMRDDKKLEDCIF